MSDFDKAVLQAMNSSKEYQDEVISLIEEAFDQKKELMMQEFINHPVTVELSSENSSNISSTLGGYGNLFGFIGFAKGSDPIGPVEEKLKNLVSLMNVSFDKATSKIKIQYTVPELDDFAGVAEYQGWRQGGNWLKGIERGIAGLKSFRSSLGEKPKGRSGLGIQMKGKVDFTRSGLDKFQNRKYMSSIINNFSSSLAKI